MGNCETVTLSLDADVVQRMKKLLGLNDTPSSVLVTLKMGISFLEKMAAAKVTIGSGGVCVLPDADENVESENVSCPKAVNTPEVNPPFSKNEMVNQANNYNLMGVKKKITRQEADEFWEYLIMTNFKVGGGTGGPVNLSNVGVVLNHWRSYNANKAKEAESRQRRADGNETESERSARIMRSLREDPDDCL